MAKERTLTITRKCIINEGRPDEFSCDDAYLAKEDFTHLVYFYRQDDKYGILDHTGKILVPPIYDNLDVNFEGSGKFKPFYECILATKDGKQGIITYDGQIIFPFIYKNIYTDFLAHNYFGKKMRDIKHVFYSVSKAHCKHKYGLAKFPSGKAIFSKCEYVGFIYDGWCDYNVGIKSTRSFNDLNHFYSERCTFDIFDTNGAVIYSGKCHRIKRHDKYKNIFIINSPGEYSTNGKICICVCYKTAKKGIQKVCTKDFALNPYISDYLFVEKCLKDPAIKKRLPITS